ncbi:hypothetical protein MHF_0170 [Mycoplasma haemofelis Ohio2]|uniref:Uncharacterized protein n=1 Tax=Mycoplasma haemofelis (strain Ohio2) TaxID=859194 RepID=F6FG05_MYCHI|nr:hypothetical protein MHF_0170 [Mycoplasma haemofelis Ohio2]
MDSKAKFLLGLSGIGTTGGVGAVLSFPHRSKQEEREMILTVISSQEKRFILSTSDSSHNAQWDNIAKEVKDNLLAQKEIGNPIDTEKLKKWCARTAQEKFYEDDLLIKFDDWCTRNTIRTEVLSKLTDGKSLIEFENSGEWTKVQERYKTQATSEDIQITIGETKITKDTISTKKADDIRDWCKSMSNALFISDTDNSYKAFDKWCVSPQQ